MKSLARSQSRAEEVAKSDATNEAGTLALAPVAEEDKLEEGAVLDCKTSTSLRGLSQER